MAFLIDKYLPEYTYNEYHQKLIHASAKNIFKLPNFFLLLVLCKTIIGLIRIEMLKLLNKKVENN
jgi:hypothetical protein